MPKWGVENENNHRIQHDVSVIKSFGYPSIKLWLAQSCSSKQFPFLVLNSQASTTRKEGHKRDI